MPPKGMGPATWDPSQYLKFEAPRLRPALDLIARIPLANPGVVYDLGCGTGNITRLLAERWPSADVTGVDLSPEMLAAAAAEPSRISWVEADVRTWRAPGPANLIFSNAAFQWVEDHGRLLPRLLGELNAGGVLAVQLPRHYDAPSHTMMVDTGRAGPWRERLAPLLGPAPVAPPEDYYELLAPRASRLEIWETVYLHVLEGENAVVEWMKGSALRPIFEHLSEAEREAFVDDYTARVADAYPRRPDGRTLLPFRRLFILATV